MRQNLQYLYDRCIDNVGINDPYKTDKTLGIHDVLKAHFLIADFFIESGNQFIMVGPRDINLLHSSVGRQHAGYGKNMKWHTSFDLSATLFYGLIKDHPFHDANKRTALLCLLYQLSIMRFFSTCMQKELENIAVYVAHGELGRYKIFRDLRQKGNTDPEVRTISWFLKKNTRKMDKKFHSITYKKLRTILNRHGYDLQNPSNNKIDIVPIEERREMLKIWKKKEKIGAKVAQVGFPGWTKQVGKGAINTVRKATNLTADYGFDSSTFFKGEDPIDCLISHYQEPLINLSSK